MDSDTKVEQSPETVAKERTQEHIMFQYIMNYKAYRRKMIATRLFITLVIAGGLFGLCALNILLGIVVGVMPLFLGAIFIIAALHKEETYIIFDTRFVIKSGDRRVSVPFENMKRVKYKRAFYEKDLMTGTIKITANNPRNGRQKNYRMKHVFAAREGVTYLKNAIGKGGNGGADNR